MISDLHVHPSAKALMGLEPNFKEKAWKTYDFDSCLLLDPLSGDILDSQSSLSQCKKGGARLIFWVIHPFERGIVEATLLQLGLKHTDGIDKKLLLSFKKRETSYYDFYKKDVKILLKTRDINLLTKDLKLDTRSISHPDFKLNVAACVEGVHSFMEVKDEVKIQNPAKFLKRIKDCFDNKIFKIFYLTLTHINQNSIFNHAFSGKLLLKADLPKFLPTNISTTGVSQLGRDIVQLCIDHKVSPDVKHMSYRARCEIYDILRKKNKGSFPPPICSHTGVVGTSQKAYYKKLSIHPALRQYQLETNQKIGFDTYKYKKNIYVKVSLNQSSPRRMRFTNHRSLNLYDEDIRAIAELGGLIGMVMDQRVLSHRNDFLMGRFLGNNYEYLLLQDYLWMCEEAGITKSKRFKNLKYKSIKACADNAIHIKVSTSRGSTDSENVEVDKHYKEPSSKAAQRHLKSFATNLLHVLDICKKEDSNEPYKYVCLGSDFDGIINAVNNCKVFNHLPQFRRDLNIYLSTKKHKRKTFQQNYGISVDDFLEKFFHTNIIDFYGLK